MPSDSSSPSRPKRSVMDMFAWLAGDRAEEREDVSEIEAKAEAFQELRVDDVMTPRADIVAVEVAATLGELLRVFVDSEHSRLPVYGETLDEPLGVIHIKDVVRLLVPDETGTAAPDWAEPVIYRLKRDVLFVPPSMKCADLMLKMQSSRLHMALVIDEFGGTDGLVTLEDLIESVVGEIEDEHDEAEAPSLVTRPNGVVEADGRTPLEDLETALEASLAVEELEEEVDTAAGLVGALAGRVPQRGEVVPHPAGFDFEVMDADPRRVKRLRIRRRDPAAPAA
ncbi:MAG: hemolysin family protein [Caulobacteraceae bacterium]|nr:hemolysin family protein [Caulobacteraceae bacterium]